MKQFLKDNWFKIFIVSFIFLYLIIQWAEFNASRLNKYTYCRNDFSKEDCRKAFSLLNTLFPDF